MVWSDATASAVFDVAMPIYDKYIIEGKYWTLEFKPEFYFGLVAPIITEKTYTVMVTEENDKKKKIEDAVTANMGVRCYTTHAAKGLEADDVYIIDADKNIFPSDKAITRYRKAGCSVKAAEEIRNERHLLYVAATRAKENLYIVYNTECSPLISSPESNEYNILDEIYINERPVYEDLKAFKHLFNVED